MKVKLINDTIVRLPKGTELDVDDAEGLRLIAFKNAVKVEDQKPAKKKNTKKAGK